MSRPQYWPPARALQYTFGWGGNGHGKTTVCAPLRSLQTGDPAHIIGRARKSATKAPEAELLLEEGVAKFADGAWNITAPEITIFDGMFIADNVHSGDTVAVEQKRNLYRIILGTEGVALAQDEVRLAGESRAKTGELTTAEKMRPHLPAKIALADFLALEADADIDGKVADQSKLVAGVSGGHRYFVLSARYQRNTH